MHLEATVLNPTGGRPGRTVTVEGTYGSVSFEVFATIDGGLTQGSIRGKVADAMMHLDFERPLVQQSVRGSDLTIDIPGQQVGVSGSYDGPPELLAILVGAVLDFL